MVIRMLIRCTLYSPSDSLSTCGPGSRFFYHKALIERPYFGFGSSLAGSFLSAPSAGTCGMEASAS